MSFTISSPISMFLLSFDNKQMFGKVLMSKYKRWYRFLCTQFCFNMSSWGEQLGICSSFLVVNSLLFLDCIFSQTVLQYILKHSLINFFRVKTVDYATRRESFGNASSFYSSRFYYGSCFHSRNYWHVIFILFNLILTHTISNLCGTCYCCSYDFRKPCST